MKIDALEILKWGKNKNREKKSRFLLPKGPKFFSNTTYPSSKSGGGSSRNVVVSVSYKTYNYKNLTQQGKDKVKANTKDAIDYYFRFDDKEGFSADSDNISKEEAQQQFADDAVFKIMISPENPEVLTKNYIKKIMKNLEEKAGKSLKWIAIKHDNTDHPHTHIVISRTDGKDISWQQPLHLDREIISEGIREYSKKLATQMLGPLTHEEIKRPFYSTVHKIGLARIDHVISGNPKKNTNLFVPSEVGDYCVLSEERFNKLPLWKRDLISERLKFHETTTKVGFKRVSNEWRLYNPDSWKRLLMDQEKLSQFKEYKDLKIIHSNAPLHTSIKGTVVDYVMVDDNSSKIGLVVKSTENKLYYVESEVEYGKLKGIKGKSVEVTPRKAASARYQTPVVNIKN